MKVTSQAFKNQESIPSKYTGEGEDLSPTLTLEEIPANTETIAIIMDDPDAPTGTFTHWLAWNLSSESEIPEGASLECQGTNHFDRVGYNGPLPPPGTPHRYFFKLFALDARLDLPKQTDKPALEKAMEGHILDTAQLIGIYER